MKKKSITILSLIIFSCSVFAQYSEMSIQEMVNRRIKAANIDYTKSMFLLKYMERFDEIFGTYSNNEFELNEKSAHFKQEIASSLQNLSEQKIFVADFNSTFGEYDFATSEFSFNPTKHRTSEDGTVKKYLQFTGIDGSPFSDSRLACGVRINNLEFVNGIKIEKEEAQAFLKNRSEEGYGGPRINRTVYLRIYYVANLNKIGDYLENYLSYSQFWLQAEPVRVEVWGDKCRKSDLLQTYYPSDEQLSSQFHPLRENMKATEIIHDEYPPYPDDIGYTTVCNYNYTNKDCQVERLQLQLKNEKGISGQKFLVLRLITSYQYHIKPGFVLKFMNKESGMEYPLVIFKAINDMTATRESEAAELTIKITQRTIDEILASNCGSIHIQLNGVPEYEVVSNNPNGVSNSVNVIDIAPDAKVFNLGSLNKSSLFTILKH